MSKRYNLYNFEASFHHWLLAGIEKTPVNTNIEEKQCKLRQKRLTKTSVKNYLSDLRHFLGWLIIKLKVKNPSLNIDDLTADKFVSQITLDLIEDYKGYLLENNIPIKTVNRRLSTLRKFFSFCISQGWLKENLAKKISNVKKDLLEKTDILLQFKKDLEKEGLDKKTIKSYLEDIQEFLSV